MKPIVLIPAFQPDESLFRLVANLRLYGLTVVIVDDGSGAEYSLVFDSCAAHAVILTHPENRGKGAALKTGLDFIQKSFPAQCVVVTADADGQHAPEDILRAANAAVQAPETLILGSRKMERTAPLRSRFGNAVTRTVFRLSTGTRVYDTQTGLRAFTWEHISWMRSIPGERYEYEMNVLLHWAREGRPITELPIQTIYQDGNRSSHFRTVQDSWRIYREILLFSGASFLSFLLDYGLFCLLRLFGGAIVFSNITARLISAIANYHLNRKAVFQSAAPMAQSALRYAMLAAGILTVNTLILNGLTALGLPSLAAKLLTELMLFSASWLIQRRWVFSHAKMEILENPPLPGEEEAA